VIAAILSIDDAISPRRRLQHRHPILAKIFGSVSFGDGFNTFSNRGGRQRHRPGERRQRERYRCKGGGATDHFYGAGGGDNLYGGGGNDFLDGGTGNDSLTGGAGDDSYVVGSQLDVIVETTGRRHRYGLCEASYTLQAGVEVEYLSAGMASNLTLVGNEFAQTITGTFGNDTLGRPRRAPMC